MLKIMLITQDDPFYLSKELNYLFNNLPQQIEIVGCILLKVSPFGKSESFLNKITRTYRIFGLKFFLYYSFKYFFNKFSKTNKINNILKYHGIKKIDISGNINSVQSINIIKSYNPDLIISIAGNQIFKKPLIDLAPNGCLNLHTALLPKYRGLMPSFWVLKNNEKYTGVTVFFVDEGIDSGPILVQKVVEISNRTQDALIRYTKRLGMDSIIEGIQMIQKGDYTLIPNPDNDSTYYSFPTRKDVIEFKRNGNKFY